MASHGAKNLKQWISDGIQITKRYWTLKKEGIVGRIDIGRRDPFTIFDFTKLPTLKRFECISDEQFGGLSELKFGRSKHGRAVMTGKLETTVPEDVDVDYSGHIGIRSFPVTGLFDSREKVDLKCYDCFEMKYRGDGRPYMLNIQMDTFLNHMHPVNDVYQQVIWTKGGPHWEVERFPIGTFLATYEGMVQDFQGGFHNVDTVGISLNDKKVGPFRFEIEYIKIVQLLMVDKPELVHHRPDVNPFPDPRVSLLSRWKYALGYPPYDTIPHIKWREIPGLPPPGQGLLTGGGVPLLPPKRNADETKQT